jgi:hypothetical protein
MKRKIVLIGNKSKEALPILEYVIPNELVKFITLEYNEESVNIALKPNMVVFMDFEYRDMDYYLQFTALSGRHSVLERPLSGKNGRPFLVITSEIIGY